MEKQNIFEPCVGRCLHLLKWQCLQSRYHIIKQGLELSMTMH
jgi:hypothetical protein